MIFEGVAMKAKLSIGLLWFAVGLIFGYILSIGHAPAPDTTDRNNPHRCGIESMSIAKPEEGFKLGGQLRLQFSRDEQSVIRDIVAIYKMDQKKSLDGEYIDVLADKFATVTRVMVFSDYVHLEWYAGQDDNCADVTVNSDTWKIHRIDFGGGQLPR
jgi:hypothetical protein